MVASFSFHHEQLYVSILLPQPVFHVAFARAFLYFWVGTGGPTGLAHAFCRAMRDD